MPHWGRGAIEVAIEAMKRHRLGLAALTALTLVSQTGCFGKFALVRAVYGINDGVGNKVLKSLVTWVFVIVPVYAVAGFLDFVIFNTIEFYSGSNPVGSGPVTRTYAHGGDELHVTYTKEGGKIVANIRHERDGKLIKESHLVDDGVRVSMKSELLAGGDPVPTSVSAVRNADGSVVVDRGDGPETMKPGTADALVQVFRRRAAESQLAEATATR